jgi:DNA (cytosine-5)-methyltransferase 1
LINDKCIQPNSENHIERYPILSFFSGAGFLDMGFEQAGFNIVWTNEYNLKIARIFNHGMSLYADKSKKISNTSSIIDIGPNLIAKEAFNNTPIPKIFGIIGGPPCPDFSIGGKNLGNLGANGKLSKVYVERITELQPTFFLFENVPGLLRTHKHREFFELLLEQLRDDYKVDYRVLNALEYGAPQDRERVFVVGFHKKWLRKNRKDFLRVNDSSWFPWPEKKYPDAKKKYNWPDTNLFGEDNQKPMGIPDELMVGPLILNQGDLTKLPNSREYFRPCSEKFTFVNEGDVSKKSFKRLHRWRYSPTAAYGNNEVHLHPTLPRRLSVRETLRIQTVPDAYQLPSDISLSVKFKAIGNGVPVVLAHAVATSFIKILNGDISQEK